MTITAEQRKERLQELRRQGVGLPYLLPEDLEGDFPPPSLRDSLWLAFLYDRPRDRLASEHPYDLGPVQEAWEKSKRFVDAQLERQAEREAATRAEQAAKAQVEQDRRQAEADQVKAHLRDRFLSLPGTTPEDLEQLYLRLLADHRRRELEGIERADNKARAELARLVRAGF